MYRPKEKFETVIVHLTDKFGLEHYTVGSFTGETSGENFRLKTESPYVEEDIGYYHKEDMYEFTEENRQKYID